MLLAKKTKMSFVDWLKYFEMRAELSRKQRDNGVLSISEVFELYNYEQIHSVK